MEATNNKLERILIFVPMYNCADQIGRVVAQFKNLQDDVGRFGVLCVDNRSTDNTLRAAEAALANCAIAERFLLQNNENYGLGGSHKVAIDFASNRGYDYIVVLHGDDQGSIVDLLPLLVAGTHRQCDALLGARFMPGATLQGYSTLRTVANIVFNSIFSWVVGRKLFDLGSGLNMFRVDAFSDGFHGKYADNLTFNYYLIIGLCDRGSAVRFFPINWREDDQVSNAKLTSQGVSMLKLLWSRIVNKAAFLAGEHRDIPRSSYPATMMRSWGDSGGN